MGRRGKAAQATPTSSLPPSPSPSSPSPLQASSHTPTGAGRAMPSPVEPPARRQPVVLSGAPPSRGARCAEVAGGTAADCTAVCCCCPCGILNLLVFAVVKLPAGLCRRALLKPRKRTAGSRKRKAVVAAAVGNNSGGATRRGLLEPRVGAVDDENEDEFIVFTGAGPVVVGPGAKGLLLGSAVGWPLEKSPSEEVSELDKEMWAHFYGGGFWRSPSQRET